MDTSITPKNLQDFRRIFETSPLARIASGAVSRTDLDSACFRTGQAGSMRHRFSVDIPTMPVCDQKASGRCWIFAGLNLLREQIASRLNLEDFQLSQNYLCFYDHLEKANTFLEHVIATADLPLEHRYVSRILSEPVGDGGWWEYFVGLCGKYGVVPREAMPETYQSSHTDAMNRLLNTQLRQDALTLRKARAAGEAPEALRSRKQEMLNRVYNILAICLGDPPETFDFEYVDRDKTYHADRGLTPTAFYQRYLGEDLTETVSILHAPIPQVPWYRTCYTAGEESIFGCFQARRLNLPMEEFKAAVVRQLCAGEPVWFVCDCDYFCSRQEGIWDPDLYDYEALLGLKLSMDKGDLLNLRQCSLNHAMVLTGVNLVDGRPDRWKVQNSWGDGDADKGYYVISDAWFDRYVFTASIRRRHLTEEQNRYWEQEPMVLTPWNVLA